jgi:hypothetical protein
MEGLLMSSDTHGASPAQLIKAASAISPKLDIRAGRSANAFTAWCRELRQLSFVFPSLRAPLTAALRTDSANAEDDSILGSLGDGFLLLAISSSTVGLAREEVARIEERSLRGEAACSGILALRAIRTMAVPGTVADRLRAIASLCFTLHIPPNTADIRLAMLSYLSRVEQLRSAFGFELPSDIVNGTLLAALPRSFDTVATSLYRRAVETPPTTEDILQAVQSFQSSAVCRQSVSPHHHAGAAAAHVPRRVQLTATTRFDHKSHGSPRPSERSASRPPDARTPSEPDSASDAESDCESDAGDGVGSDVSTSDCESGGYASDHAARTRGGRGGGIFPQSKRPSVKSAQQQRQRADARRDLRGTFERKQVAFAGAAAPIRHFPPAAAAQQRWTCDPRRTQWLCGRRRVAAWFAA